MSNFKKAIRAARKFLKHQSPAWLNVEINRDFFENFTAAIAPAPNLLPPVSDSPLRGQPHWRRIAQVYEILDRATKEGMVSYPSYVTLRKFDEFTLFQPTKNQGFILV